MISKLLKFPGLQPPISKLFLNHYNNFFLTVGQNNFGNKIPFPKKKKNLMEKFNIKQNKIRIEQFFLLLTITGMQRKPPYLKHQKTARAVGTWGRSPLPPNFGRNSRISLSEGLGLSKWNSALVTQRLVKCLPKSCQK